MGVNIIPLDVFESVREVAKKYHFLYMFVEFATAFTGWMDPDVTTKHLEVTEVGLGAMTALKSRECIVLARKSIFDMEVGMECIRSELDLEVGTMKNGPECIANHLVCTFDGAVLMGAVNSCGANVITKLSKKSTYLGVIV
jgi:hypothetical protein